MDQYQHIHTNKLTIFGPPMSSNGNMKFLLKISVIISYNSNRLRDVHVRLFHIHDQRPWEKRLEFFVVTVIVRKSQPLEICITSYKALGHKTWRKVDLDNDVVVMVK